MPPAMHPSPHINDCADSEKEVVEARQPRRSIKAARTTGTAGSSKRAASTGCNILELSIKRRREVRRTKKSEEDGGHSHPEQTKEDKGNNVQKLTSGLQALVEKAKSIEKIDEESVVAIATSLEKAIDIAKERAAYFEYIPSLKEHYSTTCFDDTTEGHLCDLVWAFQKLDQYREGEHENDDCMLPSIAKVLYLIEETTRDGQDEAMAKRWNKADFKRFWQQLY